MKKKNLSLREGLDLFEALAYSFLDELRSALVAKLALLEDLVDLLDKFLWDADRYEIPSTWLGGSQFQSPLYR